MFRSVQLCDGAYEEALVWVDRNGREDPVPAPPRSYGSLSTVESSWRGMIQRREHLPLAFEPGEPSEVCGKGIGKHLQRIVPFERRVPGAPHAPHAALSDAGDDLIGPEANARCQGHGRRHSTPNGCAGYRKDAQVVWLTSNVTAIAPGTSGIERMSVRMPSLLSGCFIKSDFDLKKTRGGLLAPEKW